MVNFLEIVLISGFIRIQQSLFDDFPSEGSPPETSRTLDTNPSRLLKVEINDEKIILEVKIFGRSTTVNLVSSQIKRIV